MKTFCMHDRWSGLSYPLLDKAFLLWLAFLDGTVTAAKKKHRFLGGADAMVYYSYLLQGDQSCVIKVIR